MEINKIIINNNVYFEKLIETLSESKQKVEELNILYENEKKKLELTLLHLEKVESELTLCKNDYIIKQRTFV